MKVHYNFDEVGDIKNPVVTTGTFDGVHVGHLVIINRLKELARQIDGESVLITFHPHPRKVLYPEKAKDLKLINSQEEKIMMLGTTGLDHLIILEFTLDFSKTTSDDFVNNILLNKLNARVIVVGFNHHFGHNRTGDYSYLYDLSKVKNFQVEEIEQQVIENEAISSTRIRKAITDGHIGRVNAYLDHHYIIYGNIVQDECEFEKDISQSIIVEAEEKLLPPDGRYAVKVEQNGQLIYSIVDIVTINNVKKIFVCSLHDENIENNIKSTIFFFKKIRLNENGIDDFFKYRVFDKEEVAELIY